MIEKRDRETISPADILAWYAAVGVDLAVEDEPVDRFAEQAAVRKAFTAPAATPEPATAAAAAPVATDAGAETSRALATGATDLEALRAAMDGFEGCGLKLRAKQLVFGDGNPEADIMLIGEAPGRDEDLQGRPFVGRSGMLLDKMLAAAGLDRSKVFIANTVPWRPPGNRTPTPAETEVCLPFLHRQIDLVAPRFLMTLGSAATQTLFGQPMRITQCRGRWQNLDVNGRQLRVLPSFHPAFLLRQPAQKHLTWLDLLTLKAALSEAVDAS